MNQQLTGKEQNMLASHLNRAVNKGKCTSQCQVMWTSTDQIQHKKTKKLQEQPYLHVPPKYCQKQQAFKVEDASLLIDIKKNQFLQQVKETLLFYAKAIDSTMLTALSSITEEQAKTTETMKTTIV